MRRLWLGVALLSVACASGPIKKQDQAALAQADALILQGCYDCLLEARQIYERIAVGKARPLVVTRLFEAQLLITLREKELGLDFGPALARAEALGKEQPATIEAARHLAVVDAVPPDETGWPRREIAAFRQARAKYVPRIDEELKWLETGPLREPVRQYLALSIDCTYPGRKPPPRGPGGMVTLPAPPGAPPDAPPLVVYQMGICRRINPTMLGLVRAAEPRFVETAYFLGRLAESTAPQNGPGKSRELLTEAYKRFPKSPSVTYISGHLNQLTGDCREALRFYDETLAIKKLHENALLGRTVCLSYLKRTDEAIAAATFIIDSKLDNTTDGYYWRAWNRHFRKELDLARADIEQAKVNRARGDVYTLAGVIEHDQDDLAPAETDLKSALNMSGGGGNCTAMWYLSLVYMKKEQWLPSAKEFEGAMHCYDRRVQESKAGLKAMQAREDLEPDFRARQIAGFEAAIKEDESQYYASAFNAANHYGRGGNIPKARELVEIAAKDPALADKVAELKKILGTG